MVASLLVMVSSRLVISFYGGLTDLSFSSELTTFSCLLVVMSPFCLSFVIVESHLTKYSRFGQLGDLFHLLFLSGMV